jgi:hypothetical protein
MEIAEDRRFSIFAIFLGLAILLSLDRQSARGLDRQGIASAGAILSPDLTFLMDCPRTDRGDVEAKTELFLNGYDFRVLNLAAIQHRHNFHLLDTNIQAVRHDQAFVEMTSVPSRRSLYAFGLYSRPPTTRLSNFENAALDLVSELRCEARQIRRLENGSGRRRYFDAELKRIENLFEEADRINGEHRK